MGLDRVASPAKNSCQCVAEDRVLGGPDVNRPCRVGACMFHNDTLGLTGLQQTIRRSLVKDCVERELGKRFNLSLEINVAGFSSLNRLDYSVDLCLSQLVD